MGSGSSIEGAPATQTSETGQSRTPEPLLEAKSTDLQPDARGASLTRVKPASRSRDGSSNQEPLTTTSKECTSPNGDNSTTRPSAPTLIAPAFSPFAAQQATHPAASNWHAPSLQPINLTPFLQTLSPSNRSSSTHLPPSTQKPYSLSVDQSVMSMDVSSATPAYVLETLMEGNRRFARGESRHPHSDISRVKAISEHQKPMAAILGCADSRAPAEFVLDQGFGDLFVCRVAGNFATPEQVASLEYAVLALHVKLIMVMGHTRCGAVQAALSGKGYPGYIDTLVDQLDLAVDRAQHLSMERRNLQLTTSFRMSHSMSMSSSTLNLQDAEAYFAEEPLPVPMHDHHQGPGTCSACLDNPGEAAHLLEDVVRENVRYQIERVKRSTVIKEALRRNQVAVVGTVYDLDTGCLEIVQGF